MSAEDEEDGLDAYEAEEIDIDDAVELVNENATDDGNVATNAEDWITCSDSAVVFREPVVIEGDMKLPYETYNGVTVIFEKGLTVSGVLEDCGGEDSVVVVLGDLDVGHLVCTTYWLVTGDIRVEGTAVGFGTLDYLLEYDGDATCKTEITSGYTLNFDSDVSIDAEDDPEGLHEECLKDDEVSIKRIVSRLKQKLPLLPEE